MGVVFELVVNFGQNELGVQAAIDVVRSRGVLLVRDVNVPLGDPFVTRFAEPPGYIELSVAPRGLGYGPPPLPDLDPRSLTDDEIRCIGHDLYSLLREFDGYRTAIVGWDPEEVIDLHELESEWIATGDVTRLDGLVLATDLRDRWYLDDIVVPFAEGYWWLPYEGDKNVR